MEDNMNMIYTIELADGTKIENVRLNGNNYVVNGEIDAEVFDGNCAPLVIEHDGEVEIHEHAELVQVMKYGMETWIVFRDLSEEEITAERNRADIEYIAMMANIDLEG